MNAGVQSDAGAGAAGVIAKEVGKAFRFGAEGHGLCELVAQADSIHRADVIEKATAGAFVRPAAAEAPRDPSGATSCLNARPSPSIIPVAIWWNQCNFKSPSGRSHPARATRGSGHGQFDRESLEIEEGFEIEIDKA